MLDTPRATNSPLVIGVSGHRDLHPRGEARLARQIDEFLNDVKRRVPHAELRIMVGMAQGADLLVARAALNAGWQIEAMLPMPLERYVEDFDGESAAALLTLLEDPSVHCSVLPPPQEPNQLGPERKRDADYTNLTEALIERCNLLLALWDGQASPLPGGTADTVLRYLRARTFHGEDRRRIEIVVAAGDPPRGPQFVYWIPTMRSDASAEPPDAPCYLSGIGEGLLAAHKAMPLSLEQQLRELNLTTTRSNAPASGINSSGEMR